MRLISTGRTDTRACALCGVTVEHRELDAFSDNGDLYYGHLWRPASHAASCGLSCLTGGVRFEEKHHAEDCAKCAAREALARVESKEGEADVL
jgi:hypothetical protein